MSQISFTCRCVHGCIEETTFQLSDVVIHSPFKNYPAKVDRWLEKLNRQKWKPDDHIKRHIWSVCRSALTTTNMASCTSPQWPRISRQCLHENTKYGVLNFRNGPNSSSILIQWLSCMEAGRRNKPLISGMKRFLSNSPRSRQQQWTQCQKLLIWVYWKICCSFIT